MTTTTITTANQNHVEKANTGPRKARATARLDPHALDDLPGRLHDSPNPPAKAVGKEESVENEASIAANAIPEATTLTTTGGTMTQETSTTS